MQKWRAMSNFMEKGSELRDTSTVQTTEQMQQVQAPECVRVQVQRDKESEGPLYPGQGGCEETKPRI